MTTQTAKPAVIIEGSVLTVPVSDAVRDVLELWAIDHGDDLNERLAAVGAEPWSIAKPDWHRVVTKEELSGE